MLASRVYTCSHSGFSIRSDYNIHLAGSINVPADYIEITWDVFLTRISRDADV